MSFVDQLSQMQDPYQPITAEDEALFTQALQENHEWHCQHHPKYAQITGETPQMIPVRFLKQELVSPTLPEKSSGEWLSTSGTKGNPTQIYFDALSLQRIVRAQFHIFARYQFFSTQPSRFLLLSPDPTTGQFPGYAYAFNKMTECAPVQEKIFAVLGNQQLQEALLMETLQRWSSASDPIYIFGLTVFFERLVLCLPGKIHFQGPIKAITGGGWKGMQQQLTRDQVVAQFREKLNGPSTKIHNLYGMSEHPLHYLACSYENFHLPKYSRFSIIGPEGNDLPSHQEGLIRLKNPFFQSLPSLDLLTEDLGYWGENCPCGESLPYLHFVGRQTSSEGTCAYRAVSGT